MSHQPVPPVVCIPGLSNDRRVFSHLHLPGHELLLTDWVEPSDRDEPMAAYCQRFATHWEIPKNAVLIGFSLGGLAAIELAKQLGTKQLILIGSIKTTAERPPQMDLAGLLPLHRLLPEWMARYAFLPAVPFFGAPEKQMQPVFRNMWEQTSSLKIGWGIQQLLTWKNDWIPDNTLHIHGDSDLIFPLRYIRQPVRVIKGGEHVLIVNHAEQISQIITEHL